MATKFVGCTLSHHYRVVHEDGSVSGGPMYYIENGLKDKLGVFSKVLGALFAIGTVFCSFGTGNLAQSHSMADALATNYGIPNIFTGVIVAVFVFLVIVGGLKRIATVTSRLVPLMAVLYVAAALLVIISNASHIFPALAMIVTDAFTGTAATGGFIGSSFMLAARFGVARGLFSNEAGQGSAPIAHAAAKTKWSVREGLVASVGPLIDTLIICTMTALVILITDSWSSGLKGVSMTIDGFGNGLGALGLTFAAKHIVAITLFLFAFSTTISWSYYGDRAVEYLIGEKGIKPYRVAYCAVAFLGTIWGLDIVWAFTDVVITFMTIPNLIGILLLFPVVKRLTSEYFSQHSGS